MNERKLLIVFIKNPVLGQVKQQLAEKIGDENALKVYENLLEHTFKVTTKVEALKAVYYSDFIPGSDFWSVEGFEQYLQKGLDFGVRMENAFIEGFQKGYERIVLVGSDIINLRTGIINKAFRYLSHNHSVIGPAQDGGYYLIGLSEINEDIFRNKKWSTNTIFKDTIADFQDAELDYKLLPVLNDIDTVEDLKKSEELVNLISLDEVLAN
ncbi:TIGR04282 family arsenosugar biosynthesis glycosyltransferase [Bacteroidota bacterium]